MVEFKLVISDPKTGKSVQRELKDDAAKSLVGKKIGDSFKGESIDLPGYEFEVCGGSDSAGFPMRADVAGTARKNITTVKGTGVKNKLRKPNPKKKGWRTIKGMRQKKTVAGNTIYEKTAQLNVKILKAGKEALFEEDKPAPAEAPSEEKKEEPNETSPAQGSAEVKEKKTEDDTVAEELDTVAEKTEEVIEDVEEVKLGDTEGDEVPISNPADAEESVDAPGDEDDTMIPGVAGDSPSEPEKTEEKAEPKEKKEKPEEKQEKKETDKADELVDEVDKLDKELENDEEELRKEDEEIEKIEKELSGEETEEKKE